MMQRLFFKNILAALAFATAFAAPSSIEAAVFYPTTYTLDNGLEVIVVPNHLAPAVNQMVWYKCGAADEIPGKTGLAHYLEHLMFRGTATVPPGEFSKIIAAQGGNDNAFTAYDYTAFYETVASDRLEMVMKMEADRMHNLQITAETAAPELHVVLDERQQRTDNSPEGRFGEKMHHLLMPGYPYGTPVIGWKKEIEALMPQDAENWYTGHYAPNNAVVIISGDVEPEQVYDLAKQIYGPIPRREIAPRPAFPPLPKPTQKEFSMVDIGVEQPQFEMETMVPSYTTQKGREAYAYEVLSEVLDSGEIGLLYQHLVRDRGIASGIGTNYDPDARGDASFTIAVAPKPGHDVKEVEKALTDYLKQLTVKPDGISAGAVAQAKERMKRSAIFARDGLMMPGYAFGMAITTGHDVQDVEEWPDHVDAVTPAEVNAALHDLVKNPHSIIAALLPDPHATQAQREAAQPVITRSESIR